ncbi:hypothetical protein [Streptomyces sp. HD]|uniref:hypothetical protein n=1 Tax=Streptomyces sp. HD TaxID=3020892 RepID=UPI00232FB254|nr:hypothetical protein [Streptomyces sp. HD]MDC0773804.1 hypothetical protein [Streptomyces sp. HD]
MPRVTRKAFATVAALAGALALFGPAAAAEAAPVKADRASKCGSLDNGELCLYGPESVSGDYTTEYCRTGGSGTINVQFGYQIDGGSRVWDGWDNQFIAAGNCGSYKRHLSNLGSDDRIRGIMMTDGKVYVTRWMFVG